MTSKKNTNKALFSSVIALILCCSMLVGTTFAWFTDEVTSGVNKIVAGNLDVDVLVNGDSIQDKAVLFDEVKLWEPGVVAYENLTVVNKGNLALKYELSVNFDNATKTPAGKTLADVLQVGVVPGGVSGGRDEVVSKVTTWQPLKSFIEAGELLTQGAEKIYGIVIAWVPGANDNDYNMNNGQTTVLSVDLGVQLTAWQKDAEKDSFDETYDAVVHSEAQLIAALEEGINNSNINVILGGNIQLTGTWTPVGNEDTDEYFTGTLDGKGYTISGLNVEANDYDALIRAAKDATIKNLTVEGTVNGVNAAGIVARVEGETVIENCVSNVTVTGTTKAGGIVCNVTSANAKIINCVNNADVSCGRAAAGGVGGIVGYVNGNASVEVFNCTNNGNITGTQDQTTGAVVGNAGGNSSGLIAGFTNTGAITGKNFVGDGLNRWLEDSNGLVLAGYCATPANWVNAIPIGTVEELVAFAASVNQYSNYERPYEGKNIVLTNDIDLGGMEWTPIGDYRFSANRFCGTFDGRGHTISNFQITKKTDKADSNKSSYGFFGNMEGTVKNLTIDNAKVSSYAYVGALIGRLTSGTVENCHVTNSTVACSYWQAGGMIGQLNDDCTVKNCTISNTTVTGKAAIGGMFGPFTATNADDGSEKVSLFENCSVISCAVVQSGSFGASYDLLFGAMFADIEAHDNTTNINNCTTVNTTVKGETSEVLANTISGSAVYFDGVLYVPPKVVEYDGSGIQTALDSLNSGDTLVFPGGTYNTSGSFVVPAGVTIVGKEGETVVFHQNSSAQDNLFNCAGDVVFENITFESNRKGYAITDNTKNHDTDGDITVINCKFVGLATDKNWGVYKNLNGNLTVTDCEFDNYNNAICGVKNGNGSTTTITGCTFTNINGEAIGYVVAGVPSGFEADVIANNIGLTEENVIGY